MEDKLHEQQFGVVALHLIHQRPAYRGRRNSVGTRGLVEHAERPRLVVETCEEVEQVAFLEILE